MSVPNQAANPDRPVKMADVSFPDGGMAPAVYTENADVALVNRDSSRAEMWLNEKQWALALREADILYQSPRSLQAFDGSNVTRANVARFTVAKHVNTLVPTMMAGIFYEAPPFVLRPRPNMTQATMRAKTALFAAVLEQIGFKQEVQTGMESQCLNGTGLWKRGWKRTRRIEKKFLRKQSPARVLLPLDKKEKVIHTKESDEFEVQEIEVDEFWPTFEHCPLGTVLIDPGWRHAGRPWKAKYQIHRMYLTFNDLRELREDAAYQDEDGKSLIPEDEDLKKWFEPEPSVGAISGVEQARSGNPVIHHAEQRDTQTSEDPMEKVLLVEERWDKNYVRTVVDKKFLIRKKIHGMNRVFYSANWWNIQDAGYGMGMGKLVGSDQRVEQGTINALLDMLSMWINQQFMRSEAAQIPTQEIRARLGGIITVQGEIDKAGKWMEGPKIPPELFSALGNAQQTSNAVAGSDEALVQGQITNRQGIARTATGAGAAAAASAGRIQGPVGNFVDNVFIPFLEDMDEDIREHMPLSQIRRIVGEELGQDWELDEDNLLNAANKFEVLAGAHLAAKKAMAQSLPFMIPLLENPHLIQQLNATGWTVDVKELFEMILEMSEWKNNRDLIRHMTQAEFALFTSMDPALQRVRGDLMKLKEKQDGEASLVDQKNSALMARDVFKKLLDSGDEKGATPGGANPRDYISAAPERAAGYETRQAFEHGIESGPFGGA